MSEKVQGDNTIESDASPQCPWCSATLASADDARCPSCNAALHEGADVTVPGVTSVDHEAILRSRKPQPRQSGLMGWLAGSSQEQPEHPAPAPEPTATFDPPNDDVKREMLRMEIAAIEARTEAERSALEAELGIAARAAVPHVDLDREAVLSEDTTDDGTGQPG